MAALQQDEAPNVEVTSSCRIHPGAGAYIRIRGANSLLGANQPLMVVDDFSPSTDSSRNIEDLESAGVRGYHEAP